MSGAGMSIMAWIILGGAAGWIAGMLMGERRGCLADILIGIIGGLLGGFLFSVAGQRPLEGFSFWSFFVAVIGSILLFAFFRAISSPKG